MGVKRKLLMWVKCWLREMWDKYDSSTVKVCCLYLPPANEVCEGYVFTGVCLSMGGGMHGCSQGGHAWLLWGWGWGHVWLLRGCAWLLWGGHAWLLWGAMCGCCGGTCVVALRGVHGCSGGHVWLLWEAYMVALGGMHGCSRGHAWLLWGRHVWLLWGGMCGCSGGCAWLLWGACMVAPGGHAWLLLGGVWLLPRGCAWLLLGGCAWDMTRYADMINEWVVRILLECILVQSIILSNYHKQTLVIRQSSFVLWSSLNLLLSVILILIYMFRCVWGLFWINFSNRKFSKCQANQDNSWNLKLETHVHNWSADEFKEYRCSLQSKYCLRCLNYHKVVSAVNM